MHAPTSPPLPPAFIRLAWSNLAAQSAEQIGLAAAPLVAVLALGAGAGETGLLQAAQTLPFLLLSLPAGMLADRSSRRRLMAAAEILRALSLLAILALAALGLLSLPLLALLGFVGATGTVAYSVAAPSLVPALVPRAALVRANGRIELARTAAFAAGPALAGTLVAWTGAAPSFAFAAGLSLAAGLLFVSLPEPPRPAPAPRHVLDEIKEGGGFVLGHSLLLPIFLTQLVFNTAFFVLQAVYVPYAVHRLGLSAAAVGATLSVYGIGMVAGALMAPRINAALPFGLVIVIGPVVGLAASIVMALTIWFPSAVLAAISFFLIGIGPIIWVISTTTLRQSVTPPGLLGRVSAIFMMATGARPLGAAIGALVGSLYGMETCLIVATAGFLLQAVVILTSPVLRLARQPDAEADGRVKSSPALMGATPAD
ncbi:MAG: MFS transporter [Proteobacteria bacterium]|nr:MFS transporter [Pseudomonadota bacterium]MBI3498622.1 MFS transporter [Pseudomonadota bacterium]